MRRIDQRAYLAQLAMDTLGDEADQPLIREEIGIAAREEALLQQWEQDLLTPSSAAELLNSFDVIAGIVDDGPFDQPEPFPPLTAEYRDRLKKALRSC